jgi:hypothetical protein
MTTADIAEAAPPPVPPDRRAERARIRAEIRRTDRDAQIERDARQAELSRRERTAAAAERERERKQRRAGRLLRHQARVARLRALAVKLRPVISILLVNAAALYGQIGYGYGHYTADGTPGPARLAIALIVAAATETVSLYVGWHAHDALLSEATATAAHLRRVSYLIAGAVAAINYGHFAPSLKAPNATAVAFGLMSLLSPWLWGLHTRRMHHLQLVHEGVVDCPGAVFGAARRRAFPIRTLAARRWSIDHGVVDPLEAWAGYNAERAARQRDVSRPRHVRRFRRGREAPAATETVSVPVGAHIAWPPAPAPGVSVPVSLVSRSTTETPAPAAPPVRPPAAPRAETRPPAQRPAQRDSATPPRRRDTETPPRRPAAPPATRSTETQTRPPLVEAGAARQAMEAHWYAERAEGRTPSGADLDRAAGSKNYGRKVRRELLRRDEQGRAVGT